MLLLVRSTSQKEGTPFENWEGDACHLTQKEVAARKRLKFAVAILHVPQGSTDWEDIVCKLHKLSPHAYIICLVDVEDSVIVRMRRHPAIQVIRKSRVTPPTQLQSIARSVAAIA